MFPTEQHMNMGGSLHGGSVMSFIDMSMFAGGLCAGMERGHYVTLDLTTHFLARGKPGSPLDAHVELVRQTRGHAFLQGVVYAGRLALLQLQRDPEAHPRAQRAGMSGPVGRAYDQLVKAGELKPDPAQERAAAHSIAWRRRR